MPVKQTSDIANDGIGKFEQRSFRKATKTSYNLRNMYKVEVYFVKSDHIRAIVVSFYTLRKLSIIQMSKH